MRFDTWHCAALGLAIGIAGCSDSEKKPSPSQAETSKAVAEALTTGVKFQKGVLKHGDIPKADADDVTVTENDEPLQLEPGGTALMTLDVDNPDQDEDPVVATLVQFDGAEDHVEVEVDADADAGADAAGHIETSFDLGDDICDDFCNQKFPIVMFQAIQLKGGKVSKQIKRTFDLDCRKKGDPDKCENAGDGKTTTKDAGKEPDDTSAPTATGGAAAPLSGAMASFNRASCMTCDAKSTVYCNTAPFPKAGVDCVAKVVNDNADDSDVVGWANCVAAGLKAGATTCGQVCDDKNSCSPSAFTTSTGACNELPAAVQADVDDCMLVPDAGSSAS